MAIVKAALAVCAVVGTGPANADRQETSAGSVEVTRMAAGLCTPSAIAFLPDGAYLIAERGGRLLPVRDGLPEPVSGTPRGQAEGRGGLLDVAVARDFKLSQEIFLTVFEARRGGSVTTIAVGRLEIGSPI